MLRCASTLMACVDPSTVPPGTDSGPAGVGRRIGLAVDSEGNGVPSRDARARIALIDDDDELVSTLRALLVEEGGYEILVCTEGDHAYDFVREHRPDLVLLDISLGSTVTGWSILELLTYDADTQHIPILVLTGTASTIENLPIARIFGIKVVAKPFETDRLLESIEIALAGDVPLA